MHLENRFKSTETHQFRMIFNNTLNDNGSLFGGLAMQWMDEVAYITAIRFTRQKVVTVKVQSIKFIKVINPGSMIEIIGQVVKAGNVQIEILVEIFVETSDSDQREKAIRSTFIFAAINDKNSPIRLDRSKIHIPEKNQLAIQSSII
jgi:acyl-CoA hydrolase